MTMDFTFTPPLLPAMAPGEQLLPYIAGLYPEAQPLDMELHDFAQAVDVYLRKRTEYDARSATYSEWMTWYKANPTEKEKLVTYVTDLNSWFEASRDALQKVGEAVERCIQKWGDRGSLSAIRALIERANTDTQSLVRNLDEVKASGEETKQPPQIRPQKRPTSP